MSDPASELPESLPTVAPTLSEAAPRAAPQPLSARTTVRIWSAFIFGLCGAMMAVGLYLPPDPYHDGLGTHRQLGFPECGSIVYFGIPCPTCGCTTAVSYVAHGNPVAGFVTQPFGALVGLLGVAGVVLGGLGLVTGKWLGPSPYRVNAYATSLLVVSVAILLLAWVYKIYAYKHGIHW
jgi:hypothetical protein